ncbi:hypothetical protein MTR_2g009530 [Medicago truncatula]|uniref:Uncharacterized protein n=1 Tax=Medicago truncatula TaxID=3880 RepID=G7IPP1_MEDTR|nr:hypothetical protein MTR_2g009530 [Medicago truncatula]
MQSHTCTTSGSLSFRCDSVLPKAVRSRTTPCPHHPRVLHAHQAGTLHAHQLPLGSSPNHIILGEICSYTICYISDYF